MSPRAARNSRAPDGRSARATAATGPATASATDGLEAKLWQAADMLRNNMDAAEYNSRCFPSRCARMSSQANVEQLVEPLSGGR